jgi:hypothetical protein
MERPNTKGIIIDTIRSVDAEALYSGENVVGRRDPTIGLWRSVMVIEKGRDGGFEFFDAKMNTATNLLVGQLGKTAFDLV